MELNIQFILKDQISFIFLSFFLFLSVNFDFYSSSIPALNVSFLQVLWYLVCEIFGTAHRTNSWHSLGLIHFSNCFQNYWSHTLYHSTSVLLENCWCHAIFSAKAAMHLFINNVFLVRLQLKFFLTFFCFFFFPSDTW